MANAATARIARPAAKQGFVAGQVVYYHDRYHTSTAGRPYLVAQVKGTAAHIIALTHSPQGQWATDELGGGTYLAGIDFHTRRWTGEWVEAADLRTDPRQLTAETREAALDEAARQFTSCRH